MRRKIGLAGFALAAILTLFFLSRLVLFTTHWMDPARGMHPVEGWMTPGYIARTYDIPRADMMVILGLTPEDKPRQSLRKIAKAQGIPLADIIATVNAALAARPPR